MSEVYEHRRSQQLQILGPAQANVSFPGGVATFAALAAAWTSQDLVVSDFDELEVDFNVTVNTTSWQWTVNRKGADGVYYPIFVSATHTAAGKEPVSLGEDIITVASVVAAALAAQNVDIGDIIQIVVTPVGAMTGTLSVRAK